MTDKTRSTRGDTCQAHAPVTVAAETAMSTSITAASSIAARASRVARATSDRLPRSARPASVLPLAACPRRRGQVPEDRRRRRRHRRFRRRRRRRRFRRRLRGAQAPDPRPRQRRRHHGVRRRRVPRQPLRRRRHRCGGHRTGHLRRFSRQPRRASHPRALDPISGNVMAEARITKVWEITREYVSQLCQRVGPDQRQGGLPRRRLRRPPQGEVAGLPLSSSPPPTIASCTRRRTRCWCSPRLIPSLRR